VSLIPTRLSAGLENSPIDAWQRASADLLDIWSKPYANGHIAAEVKRRDQQSGEYDLMLSSAAWELWTEFQTSVPSVAGRLLEWWSSTTGPRAVLILDGLSLRELPMLVREAPKNGLNLKAVNIVRSELPADTNAFARALNLPQRSALENNGKPSTFALSGAQTETTHLPWADCSDRLGAHPNWVFWHHWPDTKIHEFDSPSSGIDSLAGEVSTQLSNSDFWSFVKRLAQGRELVITSDHGYAVSGLFSDSTVDQNNYLKQTFGSQRFVRTSEEGVGSFCPPVDMVLSTPTGLHRFALGRRKWKSPGGYPTLLHGGLSLLEVLLPYVEIGGIY